MNSGVLMVVWIGLLSFGSGYVQNIVGTPFLYLPIRFAVDPAAPNKNGPTYQAQYGYRAEQFLEDINQKSVETNPNLYDPTYIKRSK